MPLYSYYAINKKGKQIRGKMTASNSLDLENRVQELDCDLIDFKVEKSKNAGLGLGSKIKSKDLIMFCVHMEELDKAGVPVLDALIDLRDTVDNPKMRDLLADLCEYIKGGEPLSESLKRRSDVFDKLFVGLVAAGEDTGNIGEAFGHLARHIKWNVDFGRKIKKAVSYPIILVVVMALVVTMMMLFVVPQLVEFLEKQGFDLPFYTKALIATSDFFF